MNPLVAIGPSLISRSDLHHPSSAGAGVQQRIGDYWNDDSKLVERDANSSNVHCFDTSDPSSQLDHRGWKSIKGVVVEYGPGGYSAAHTHGNAFIYATVLEGSVRSQINDGPVTIYNTGQSWSEVPGDRHSVSANASETKPAKLLAVFVVDTNEKALTTPVGK